MPSKIIDLSGRRVDKLLVLENVGRANTKKIQYRWSCRCDCGNICVRTGAYLRQKKSFKSCGCAMAEIMAPILARPDVVAKRLENSTKHGDCSGANVTPEYKTWRGIRDRCGNPNSPNYHKYGGRGIAVSPEWIDNFPQFLSDMGRRPSDKHSIDRINPSLGYSKDNCRWATQLQQSGENKRGLRPVIVNGVHFHNLAAACRHFDLNYQTVVQRLNKGLTVERAFSSADYRK